MLDGEKMSEMIRRIVEQMLRPIKHSVLLMIGRGILTAVDASKDIQLCSVNLLADETKDKTEMFQHFGFTSYPPAQSEAIMLSVGANRDHGIIIATEKRDLRLKGLSEGDSALYNKEGKYLWMNEKNLKGLVEKIEIHNDSNELISVLIEYFEKNRDGFNETIIGPMPKAPVTVTALTEVIDKLKTFKV